MYFNSFFLAFQLIITVGLRNDLVQALDIGSTPVPDQCTSACTEASSLYNSCAPLANDIPALIACICTSGADTAIQQCINCVVPIDPSFESSFGTDLQEFNAVCGGLPPLTIPPISTPTQSTPTGSTPTESTPTGSTPTGSTPTGSTPTVSTPTGSTPTVSTPTGSTPTGSTPTGSTPTGSTPTGSTPTGSTPTESTPTESTPTESTPTVTTPTNTTTTVTTPTVTPEVTTPVPTSSTTSTTGVKSSASVTPSSGAELSVQSQLGSMGIAVVITLLLRLL